MKNSIKKVLLGTGILCISGTMFAQDRGTGLLIDRKLDEKVSLISKPMGFGENLPESVDLTKYVPAIGDQGRHGTCGGWSSTYYLATMEYAIQKGITNSKELETVVYDPYYTYLSALNYGSSDERYSECSDGTYLTDLCYQLSKNGAKRRAMKQTFCGDDLSTKHDEDNSVLDFTGYSRLEDWDATWEENTKAVCQALSDNHPVLIGMVVPPSFYDIGSDGIYRPAYSEVNGPWGDWGGHAMTIVGYDDDKNGGSFKLVNSWGEDWGDDGFLYVKYKDFNALCISAYSFETKLKDVRSEDNGCVYGDCYNGYGIQKVKGNGTYEGYFSGGEMTDGFYFNHTKKLFKGGKLFMKKQVKKQGGSLIYDRYDYKKPIGFKL